MPKRLGARAVCRSSSLDHPKDRLHHLILGHPFSSSLRLCCPSSHAASLQAAQLSQILYRVTCKVSAFLAAGFFEREVVDQGSQFLALAYNTAGLAQSEAVGICGGVLHLTVSQATYERLGLVGTRSACRPGKLQARSSLAVICKAVTSSSVQRSTTSKSSSHQRPSSARRAAIGG